jgi:HK97 family phage portal protein
MGLFDSIRQRLSGKSYSQGLDLTQQDRNLIYKLFGSFGANQIASNSNALLEQGYEGNVDVYSVIKKIVDTGKVIPRVLEQRKGDEWVRVETANSLTELMANPNKGKQLTWIDFLEQLTIYLNAAGNGIAVGIKPEGFSTIEQLDVLPTSQVEINTNGNYFFPEATYQFTFNGKVMTFDQEEIGHVRMFNPTPQDTDSMLWGLSPIQVAKQVVKVGNDRWDANASIFQNRGAIGMVTDRSNAPMTEPEGKLVQEAFNRRAGGTHNSGKTLVTNKDLNYIQLAMSPSDLQLIESGVVNLRTICNVYGIDSSLFNDPANKTFNNRKEASKDLYTDAIIPMNDKVDAMLNHWLVANHFPQGGFRLRSDYSSVESLQEDFNEKATTVSMLKSNGIITANEARDHINLEESDDAAANELTVSSSTVLLPSLNDQATPDTNQDNS